MKNKSVKKNQHYVPQFYLRNFSENKKNIGMFIFDKNLYINNASIRSVASSEFLYGKDGVIENALGKVEGKWAQIIQKIINKNFCFFSDQDYILLYSFIIVSYSRTLKIADTNRYYAEKAKQELENDKINNIIYNAENKLFLNNLIEMPNIQYMDIALKNIHLLKDLGICVLENKTRYGFITSDNPIILYNQLYCYRNYNRNYGLTSAGLQIFIPISEKYLICLFDPSVYQLINNNDKYISITEKKQVDALNKLSVINSYRQIYFKNNSKEKYIRNFENINRLIHAEDRRMVFPVDNLPGEIIRIGNEPISTYINLNIFKLNKEYKEIPLPDHMGGLDRVTVLE